MDYIHVSTVETAKDLLGQLLIYRKSATEVYSGYIVETEAYIGIKDEGCHAFGGNRTPKMMSLYKTGGTIYLYTMHTQLLLNIVTREKDNPQGVLIRALEPKDNLQQMERNRGKDGVLVTNGPGKLTQAIALERTLNGTQLSCETLWIDESKRRIPQNIIVTPRIGIPNKGTWTTDPLRFYVAGNRYVSLLPKKSWLEENDVWVRVKMERKVLEHVVNGC